MIPYREITIDLVPRLLPPEPLLSASQYDNGRPVKVYVQYDSTDFPLGSGVTAKIQVRKPSGKVVIADAQVSTGTNVITFNLLTQMTAEYGLIPMELSLTGDGQEPIGTANWTAYIEKSPASGSPSDTWVQDLDEKVEQAVEAAEAAESSALDAEAWAVGERDGEPVTDQDETYQNNAKYYALSSISAKEAAEAAASAAAESAGSAADSATDASGSAESASGSASASAVSAAQAAGSATAAASSASAAATSAGAAAQSATESAGYATASENSAGVSAGAAEAAGQSASAAAGSASTAATYASNASASATASAGSAAQSAQSATASATSAGQAAGSATAAAGSADAADASADRAQEILDSIPEDYSELSDDVSDLKSAIDELEELTTVTEGTSVTKDIINTVTWTSGYMVTNGTTGESSSMRYSNRFPVSKGDVVANLPDTKDFRFVCAFSGETPVSASGAQNVATYTVPDGIDGLVITSYIPASQYAPTSITHTTTEYRAKNIYEDDIAELTTSVDTIEDAVIVEQYQEETETDITPVFADGYMNTNGIVLDTGSAAYFDHTQKISVQPGDVVTTWRDTNSYPMRFVCAFSGDIPMPSSGSSDEVTQFSVPEGIDGVVVTVRDSTHINTIKVTHTEPQNAAYVKPIPMGFMMEQGSLSSGAAMVLPFHNVKNHNIYVFNANIQAFSKIKFSKESSTYVEVDSTNLIITNDQNTFTIPHGLTIANNITLMVCNETATSVTLIRVSSNGQEFNYTTATRFIMDSGAPRIESVGSTLTECTFSWVSKNINAPIWLFGDSYFSWYDNRWTYYLARDGYTKDCMLNGYAGEASADAYTALKTLLAVTTPKIVVWCMGMNDGDSTIAVNANWLAYYEKLINLSKQYGFEIVLYTVPTTPVINNQYKDAIIRSSGYRYIEADKAVRIDENGNWIPGALNEGTPENPDNVHPTPMGAKIIYYRVLSDLPEIMCNY